MLLNSILQLVVVLGTAASAANAAATPTRRQGQNLQTFSGDLGGLPPPVYQSGDQWTSSGQTYNFLIDALNQSCYVQLNNCQNAANEGGNQGDLTVENCTNVQLPACFAAAQDIANQPQPSNTPGRRRYVNPEVSKRYVPKKRTCQPGTVISFRGKQLKCEETV